MATKGSHLSTRMSAEDQKKYNSFKGTAGELFKKYKVEISNAIKKPFPIFEILRDRRFITDEKYNESRESLIKRISVQEIVYDILTELEKTFDLPLLGALFSKAIMESYPDLRDSYRIFKKELPDLNSFLEIDGENEGQSGIQLGLEQEPGKNSYSNLPWSSPPPLNYTGPATSDNGLSEQVPGTEETAAIVHTTTDNNGALESQQANEQCAQQSEPAGAELLNHGIPVNSGRTDPANIKKEKPFFNSGVDWEAQGRTDCNQASATIEISNEDSAESRNREKAPEVSTSGVKRKPGTVNPENKSTPGINKKKKSPVDLGKSLTSQKAKKKRCSKKLAEFVDFHSEILPVTCGGVKGMLHKNRLEEGSTVKCIKTEDGLWFTPQEFEAAGGYKSSSNWKNTVRCGGITLKRLMEEKKLPTPPRKYSKKKKLKKPEACKVCQNGEDIFGCDTCSRFFHGYCHLPPVQTERPLRRPWSCTFCRIKESSGSQQCHGESEVLSRRMEPEEQLSAETYQCMNNFMMLNKIKKNLSEQHYSSVGSFIRDMRLIFHNHRAFNKDHALYILGLNLEAEFEQNFKKVFAIQEIKQGHIENTIN